MFDNAAIQYFKFQVSLIYNITVYLKRNNTLESLILEHTVESSVLLLFNNNVVLNIVLQTILTTKPISDHENILNSKNISQSILNTNLKSIQLKVVRVSQHKISQLFENVKISTLFCIKC